MHDGSLRRVLASLSCDGTRFATHGFGSRSSYTFPYDEWSSPDATDSGVSHSGDILHASLATVQKYSQRAENDRFVDSSRTAFFTELAR
jgi:hypothetical protein